MKKNKSYLKITIANIIIVISICILVLCFLRIIVAIKEKKIEVYELFYFFICIFANVAVYCIMDLWRRWIIFGKCDFLAQEKYILNLLRWKGYKDDVTLHKELLCDRLILGKYDEARQEIEKMRTLDSRLKPMQRLVIQLCNIDYLRAMNEVESLDAELEKAKNLLASLNFNRDRIKRKYQRGIMLRQYLIEKQWENVLELLSVSYQKNLTIYEQVVNAYICGKCCYCLGRYEEAFYELKFAAKYGGNTKYVKLANELIEQLPEYNFYQKISIEKTIKVNQRIDFRIIVFLISSLLLIFSIGCSYYCSHGNSIEEAYCRRYSCTEDDLTIIYQKRFDNYELVILYDEENEKNVAYCLLEETDSGYKMVESRRFADNQTEPIGIELPEDTKELFQESDIKWEVMRVITAFYKQNDIFYQEDMEYVGICSSPMVENVVVNGNSVSIKQVIYIDDAAVYLWSVENVDLKTSIINIRVDYVTD